MQASLDPRQRSEQLFRIHSALRSADGLRPDEAFDELVKLYRAWVGARGGDAGEVAWPDFDLRLSDSALAVAQPPLWELLGRAEDGIAADLFQELAAVGVRSGLGQYFTPGPVTSAMVEYLAPQPGEHWMDPFVGSGLLVGSVALAAAAPVSLYGTDLDERVLALAGLEAGLRHPESPLTLARMSALADADDVLHAVGAPAAGLDGIVTNPPFGATERGSHGAEGFELRHGGSTPVEILGLEQSLRLLRPGGRLGIVLPQSVLSNKRLAYVRRHLREQARIDGVLSLPAETFSTYDGVGKSSVLFLTAAVGARPVWFGRASSVGWDATGRSGPPEDVSSVAAAMRQCATDPGVVEPRDVSELMDRNLTAEWHLRAVGNGLPLGEVCDAIFTGRTPARSAYGDREEPGAVRIVKVGDLTGHGIDWSDKDRSYATFKRPLQPDSLLRVGDIVLTSSAHHPRYIAAKVDVVDVLPPGWLGSCLPAGEVMAIRVDRSRLDPARLLLWLRSGEGRAALQACVTGQTAHLHAEYVAEVGVPAWLLTEDLEAATSLIGESLATRREFERLELEAMEAFQGASRAEQIPTAA